MTHSSPRPAPPARSAEGHAAWIGALFCMLLAALTGALYRWGLITGETLGLGLGDIRHAHSHLMYLGWVTPAVMGLLASRLPALTGRPVGFFAQASAGLAILCALVSWPLFAWYGYRPVAIGTANIPLAAAASGFAMLAWYGWWFAFRRATRGVEPTPALRLWEMAHVMLFVATVGAWLLAFGGLAGAPHLLVEAGKHVFLDVFAEGWLVLALLGLAVHDLGGRAARGSLALFALIPLAFAITMPVGDVPWGLRAVAGGASILVGGALIFEVGRLLRASGPSPWRLPLALLGMKGGAQILAGVLPFVDWGQMHGLRILYLHLLLLGAVSLGLVAAAELRWGRRVGASVLRGAVLALLATLVPLSGYWPGALAGPWILRVAFAGAALASGAIAWLLVEEAGRAWWAPQRAREPSQRLPTDVTAQASSAT